MIDFSNINKTLIIAEAGVNHNGNVDIAKKLIEVASNCGADYIKFQTFKAKNIVSNKAKQADYQKKNIGKEITQYDMLQKLELKYKDHFALKEHCIKNNIGFLSSAFDIESIEFLNNLGVDLWKIPSGEITNLFYLRKIAEYQQPVLMSTGMTDIAEIEQALQILYVAGKTKNDIILLHCTTEYPAPYEDINLNAMHTLAKKFKTRIGFSDHTVGIEIPLAAVAKGACVIEKHFTLDKEMEGPDHKASADPDELYNMVKSIRNIEKAMGDGIKISTAAEDKNKEAVRKSLHLNKDMNKGQIVEEKDLTALRPGNGISPMKMEKVIGKKLLKNLKKYSMLKWQDLN